MFTFDSLYICLITVNLALEHWVPTMTIFFHFGSMCYRVFIYFNNFLGTGDNHYQSVSLMHMRIEGQHRHSVPTDELLQLKRLKKVKLVLTARGQNT